MFAKDYFDNRDNDPAGKRAVFAFIEEPENIARMIYFSEKGLPALIGIVKELEARFSNQQDFPLTDYRNRQTVGRMIKHVMWNFGYVPSSKGLDKAAHLRDFAESKLFHTSAVYKKSINPAYKLKIEIKEI